MQSTVLLSYLDYWSLLLTWVSLAGLVLVRSPVVSGTQSLGDILASVSFGRGRARCMHAVTSINQLQVKVHVALCIFIRGCCELVVKSCYCRHTT
jgi:hypothetical protein